MSLQPAQTIEHAPMDESPVLSPRVALNADFALLLCLDAWGFPQQGASKVTPWHRIGWPWRSRLDEARQVFATQNAAEALELLRQAHLLQRRASPALVHATWWTRSLHDESPAVRRFLNLKGPSQFRAPEDAATVRVQDVFSGQTVEQEIADWVITLASERLVGGEPLGVHEPAVIVAVAGLRFRELYRLIHAAGMAKSALAGDLAGAVTRRPVDGDRLRWFGDHFSKLFPPEDTRPQRWAHTDIQRFAPTGYRSLRSRYARSGLLTIARALHGSEPFRMRWALQHQPYALARRIRSLISAAPAASESVLRMENAILKAAWTRLTLENRLRLEHPEEPSRPDHAL
jgi:hypothetical protein